MKFSRQRAVSPIIASLLLIAIAVAAGIIVYVYVNSLAGGLTSGGGNQETQQLQLQAYAFNIVNGTKGTGQVMDIFLKNTGSSALSISAVYVDGTAVNEWGSATTAGIYGGSGTPYLAVSSSATSGCFALLPTTATFTLVTTSGTGVPTAGSTTACSGTTVVAGCTTANVAFCVKATSSTETGGVTGTSLGAQQADQLIISAAGTSCASTTFPSCPATTGTSHTIKIVTATGGTAVFSVTAGRTG